MRTVIELNTVLANELSEHVLGKNLTRKNTYYNEQCGFISSILARLLDLKLKDNNEWDSDKQWITGLRSANQTSPRNMIMLCPHTLNHRGN